MSKPFDYYAGYPGQQRTPKWIGLTLGSLFGGLTILSMALCIRMVLPTRTAEASVSPRPEAAAPVAPAVAAAEPADADQADVQSPSDSTASKIQKSAKHKHGARGAAMASRKPVKENPKYKKAQLFAKSVSHNRRDKKARDDLDKLLGM